MNCGYVRRAIAKLHYDENTKTIRAKPSNCLIADMGSKDTVSIPTGEWIRMCDAIGVIPDVTQTTFDVMVRKAQSTPELLEELLAVLDVAIARGERLGYEDEDYKERAEELKARVTQHTVKG